MACGGPCKIVFGGVPDFANDVTIRSASRYQLNVRTRQEVPGSRQDVPVPALDPGIVNKLKDALTSFIYENRECKAGCYCDSFGQVTTTQETFTGSTYSVPQQTTRANASILLNTDTVEQTMEKVSTGQRIPLDGNGKPVPVNGDLDEVQQNGLNCCGQPTLDILLVNHFLYDFTFDVTLTLATEQGECKSLGSAREGVIA